MRTIRNYRRLVGVLVVLLLFGCDRGNDTNEVNETEFKSFLEEKYFETSNEKTRLSDFEYQLVNGKQERFSANNGKVVLLNFWATWCYPCKQEMPDLEELAHRMKEKNFRILAVNSGDKRTKIRSFLKKYPYSFDIVLDENRDISNSLKIVGLPTTFILNQELKIVGKIIGPINWKDETFIEYLTKFSRT